MEKGFIHSFETMGLVDGPGVRTVVFLQGCPLRCSYCHNPDSQALKSKNAIEMNSDELVNKVLKQKNYFGSEGGVTFSGGEPLLQGAFVLECLKKFKKEGISTAIDTSGFGDKAYYKEIFPLVDTILLDVKAFDAASFHDLTLGKFSVYLDFLSDLQKYNYNGQIWARHVMVPGLSDNEAAMDAFVDLIAPFGYLIDRIEILPYHVMGVDKYKQLGMEYRLEGVPPMDHEKAKAFEKYAVQRFFSKLAVGSKASRSHSVMHDILSNKKHKNTQESWEVPPKMQIHLPNTKRYFANENDPSPYIINKIDLRKLPIFRYLSVKDFESLALDVEVLDVKKGDYVFQAGAPADKLYIVCFGQVKIFTHTVDGREQIMYIYNPGDFVGGHNLLTGHEYLYNAQAVESSIICTMSKQFFNRFCLNNPMILLQILEKSYDRIRWAEDLISRLSSTNAGIKVVNLLLRFASRYGVKSEEGIQIDLSLSREELGSYAGLTRETITRKLGELKDLGLLDYRSNRKIIIKDEQALRDYLLGAQS